MSAKWMNREETPLTRGSRSCSECSSLSRRNCDSAGAPSKLNMRNSNRVAGYLRAFESPPGV